MSSARIPLSPSWDTPCEFTGCSRVYHDPLVPRTMWRHEVYVPEPFDDGTVDVELSVYTDGRPPIGSIHYGDDADLMTAADYRREADTYEAYPAWLRSMADRLDALDGGTQPAATPPRS